MGLLFVFFIVACRPSQPSPPTELPTVVISTAPIETPEATQTPTNGAEQPSSGTEPFRYTVIEGDTLTGIAAQFGLQPETVLWANYDLLFDIPDLLIPGMELLILPVDGVYHQAGGGDNLASLAAFFGVEPQAIIAWPGNAIDDQNPEVLAGQWVLVPGGQRASLRRHMPNLSRAVAEVAASEFGSGACSDSFSGGPVGDGEYAGPVAGRELRGEAYWSGHPGVDLAVEIGEWVLAADDGVVVFAGWSNLFYGHMVLIDHGNGDFSLYSGLQKTLAVCGQGVAEGEVIAEAGLTGHPAGPLLHFEIRRGADFLDPLDLLPD